jgi:uncharacterized membrane protein
MCISIIQVIALSIAVLLLSGCESLPEGEPPEGPIVTIENTADQPMPLKAAINQMITALATSAELTAEKDEALLNIIPGPTTIPEKYSAQLAMSSINVYSELLTMGILDTNPAKPADYILSSTFVKLVKTPPKFKGKSIFKWEMFLTKMGESKPAWTYSLKVFLEL